MFDDLNNGLLFLNKYFIPPEILILILSNVDCKTLSLCCTLVCKLWNEITRDVWKAKCDQEITDEHRKQLLKQKKYPHYLYQMFCVKKNSFYTNLIQNGCGTDGLNHWIIILNRGDQFSTQDVADGNTIDEMVANNITKCFATSYDVCSKAQIVDLYKYLGDSPGTRQFLDEYQPPIYVSEWYGHRCDCVCIYKIRVILFDVDHTPIPRCNTNFFFQVTTSRNSAMPLYKKVEFVLKNYGPNVRYVFFYHVGHENRHFPTRNGSRFTNANVQILFPGDVSKDHVIDEKAIELNHIDCDTEKDDCLFVNIRINVEQTEEYNNMIN